MTSLIRFHQAARRLRHAPAFTLSVILTLGLGIGGATAALTVVNGVLIRPLPYARSNELVDVSHTIAVSGLTRIDLSDATYLLYRRDNPVFTDLGAYRATSVNLAGSSASVGTVTASPERVSAAVASPSVFRVLGASPLRGRGLVDEDGEPGAPATMLIGYGLWQRRFGADPAIVGRRVGVDGIDREVVGVMRADFHFPRQSELWLPLQLDPARTKSAAFDYRGVARLRDGVTPVAAAAALQQLLPRVPVVFPGRLTVPAIKMTHMEVVVRPLRAVLVGDAARMLWIVLGAVAALLLLACANVTNLFLARAEGVQHEVAVRRALGAGRAALFMDLIAESAVLCAFGGALGLAFAAGALRLLQAARVGAAIPRIGEIHVDGFTVAGTAVVSIFAALIVSALPALRAGEASLSSVLIAEGRSSSGGRTRHRARRVLVVSQMGFALVLLTAAGLFARSFARLLSVNPGFVAEHALSFRLALPAAVYPTAGDAARVVAGTLDALRALPGVQGVGVATKLPLDNEAAQDSAVYVEDRPARAGDVPDIHAMDFATPSYFSAMGMPLVAGRTFARLDPSRAPDEAPREVVVSEAFANRYWPAQSAVGRRIRMDPRDPWSTIVGVVGSVRDAGIGEPPDETVYSPLVTMSQGGLPWAPHDVAFVVRTSGDAMPLATAIDRAVHEMAPALPLYRMIPISMLQSEAAARTAFTLVVLGAAALLALVMGAVGIYGVTAYLVSLRTREIGIRVALGARPIDVRRLVLYRALTDTGIGVGVGLLGVMAVTRTLTATLFGVSPFDPATLGAASLLLLATGLAATWIPARRAAALDPAVALRME